MDALPSLVLILYLSLDVKVPLLGTLNFVRAVPGLGCGVATLRRVLGTTPLRTTRSSFRKRSFGVSCSRISFTCRVARPNPSKGPVVTRGRILRSVALITGTKRGATLINRSNSNGDALTGLLVRCCSPRGKDVSVNKRGLYSVDLRTLGDHVSCITRSRCLFGASLLRGVHLKHLSTASRRMVRTTGGTRYVRFLRGLPRNVRSVTNSTKGVLSKKRHRQVSLTQTVLGSTPVMILSRTATCTSPRGRRGVRTTVTRLIGKGALMIVTRGLPTVVGTSRVYIVSRKGVITAKGRRRLVRTYPRCRGL